MNCMAKISCFLVFSSFLISSLFADQLMSGPFSFAQSPFQSTQSGLEGPVCAECLQKDSFNVVRVVANTAKNQLLQAVQSKSQNRLSSLADIGRGDGGNFIEATSPQLISTTIYETFPTVFNGFSIIGKRTRISVFYAAQTQMTAQPIEAGRQFVQESNEDVPNRMINPNVSSRKPEQLQNYYYLGQPTPDQRSDLTDSLTSTSQRSSQFQQMTDSPPTGPSRSNVSQSISSFGADIGLLNAVKSDNSRNADFRSGLPNEMSLPIGQSGTPSLAMPVGLQPASNLNHFEGILANTQNAMAGSTINQEETAASLASSSSSILSTSDTHFQGLSPQPSQNFALLADSLAQSNGRQGGGTYQSLSAYSIQGTDGFITMGQATFVAPSVGAAFTTVTDLRTVSPTNIQPVGSFMTSSSRLEAFFVPIGKTRLQGERTRYSYYYVLPGPSGDTRIGRISPLSKQDSQSSLSTPTSLFMQPTPILTTLPSVNVQAITKQNSFPKVELVSGESSSQITIGGASSDVNGVKATSIKSDKSEGSNNSSFAHSANQLDDSPIGSSFSSNVRLQADVKGNAQTAGVTFQSNGNGFMTVFQNSNTTKRQNTSRSSQNSDRLTLISSSNQLASTTIRLTNDSSRQATLHASNTNRAVSMGTKTPFQDPNMTDQSFHSTSDHSNFTLGTKPTDSQRLVKVGVDSMVGSGQASTSAGGNAGDGFKVNSHTSSPEGLQRFTIADANSNQQLNLNNLDSIYNPTYNSNSRVRTGDSIFGTDPPAFNIGENKADMNSFNRMSTSNDTTDQVEPSNRAVQLLNLSSGPKAASDSSATFNVNQFTLLDWQNSGTANQNVKFLAVQPFAISSLSQAEGTNAQAAGGVSSSSSGQVLNSVVQSSI